ncbi:MAG: molybdopterin-dependent oxidoreductase [Candidatus Eremiobacteraeota bacterium]|nr:molybdopterin-dependent oxidoreductase [Candidatus Eremiobacteraeota bacterium]
MPENETINDVTVTIDGVQVRVPKGTLLVEAAKAIRREIPVYCYHPKMGPAGLCRICLVEIEGMPKLQIACNTQVSDGMVVHTESGKASDGRRAVLELYLVNHPLDCPICDKGGECDLQDYAMAYGQGASRVADPKASKPKAVDLGPTIVLDEERCVVCQRCVRFDDIITGNRQLVLKDRGVRNIIATATGDPYHHNFTGNVTELCPVGALTSKTYRFKSRPWDLKRVETSCTQCSVGCRQFVDTRFGIVQRTMSVESDDAISDGWLCDRGRYNVGFYNDERRLTQPLYKQDGEFVEIGWDDAIALWARAIEKAGPQRAAVLGGGRLTNEEAYLLQHVFRTAGVRDIDWRSGRQMQATPGRDGGSLAALETADAIVEIGESPLERAPVMHLRVRKAVKRGAKLIRVASYEVEPPAAVAAVEVPDVDGAVRALPSGAKTIALVWDGVDAGLATALRTAMPAGATILTYITGEQGNARGAEAMGVHPAFGPGYVAQTPAARDVNGIVAAGRDGSLDVLSIFGANPALHYPDGPAIDEALDKTPFVVVSELFMTETAKAATLVLPAKAAYEKDGTTTNMAGDVLPLNAAHELTSPEGARTDLEMLVALAQALGIALPSIEELDATVIGHLAHAPESFGFGDDAFALRQAQDALRQAQDDREGLRVVVGSSIFAGGGTIAHDARLAELEPLPEVAISTEDAAAFGVQMGDYVDLVSGNHTMHDLLVEVRPNLARGVAVLIGGLPDDPANVLGARASAQIVNVRSAQSDESAVRA